MIYHTVNPTQNDIAKEQQLVKTIVAAHATIIEGRRKGMHARSVKTIEDAQKIINERNLKHVKVGVFDIDGIFRGKYMAKNKFFSALEKGFGFCDVVLGWDCDDQLYDNVKLTGWHTGYPDGLVHIDPTTCRGHVVI